MLHQDSFENFFHAKSIAVIGASENGLYPAGIIQNLINKGFAGQIFPVNPNRETVFGLPCYPSVTAIKETITLAVIVVRRDFVLEAVRDCAEKGVFFVLIVSAGFAEADDTGKMLQKVLRKIAHQYGMRILGPNCAGYADISQKLIVTRLPLMPKTGGVSFVSGSGALMMAVLGLFNDRKIGMNRLISVGNQMDITLGEAINTLAEDEKTTVIGTFVEGIKNGSLFKNALKKALIKGKPVVLVKSGRTASGQKAAATHTAAVAGSHEVFSGVCKQFGAALVDDMEPMMDLLQVHAAFGKRLTKVRRIMVVTQSGGMGSLTADFLEMNNLPLASVDENLVVKIRQAPYLNQYIHWDNPADVRGTSLREGRTALTLKPFLNDKNNDLVILLLARTTVQQADLETARGIVDAYQSSTKPILVVWVGQRNIVQPESGENAEAILLNAGIPTFNQGSTAVNALAAGVNYWSFRDEYLKEVGEVLHE